MAECTCARNWAQCGLCHEEGRGVWHVKVFQPLAMLSEIQNITLYNDLCWSDRSIHNHACEYTLQQLVALMIKQGTVYRIWQHGRNVYSLRGWAMARVKFEHFFLCMGARDLADNYNINTLYKDLIPILSVRWRNDASFPSIFMNVSMVVFACSAFARRMVFPILPIRSRALSYCDTGFLSMTASIRSSSMSPAAYDLDATPVQDVSNCTSRSSKAFAKVSNSSDSLLAITCADIPDRRTRGVPLIVRKG